MLIDFTKLKHLKKTYGGANGNKISILYNDSIYMIKFPSTPSYNKNISYTNSCISEYLGSHIFNMLGVEAQETILGKYEFDKKIKVVVCCKDFEEQKFKFQDFASVKNQVIDSESNGYGTELKDILDSIEKQYVIDTDTLLAHFWDMFVIDAFLANWDRHNGNWGFLYNLKNDTIKLAPIFDLGSSLFAQLDEKTAKEILVSKAEQRMRVVDYPTSALFLNKKRINYYDFITTHKNKDCDEAIKRIVPRINLKKINKLIDEVEPLSENYKKVLKLLLKLRKEMILDKAYNDLIK